MQHKPMKHKRISVSLPIPLLAKIYLLWRGRTRLRLRVITKDKKILDFDVKVPISINTSNLHDKFAVMIVEEVET